MSVTLSFDIGHASIGWAVLEAKSPAPTVPEILGTGVVTFPTNGCLASQRRVRRRMRRHIRSTRQRVERLKKWLIFTGILTKEELDRPGHPAPFLLAAAAIRRHKVLSALELWQCLRWYAHNRGYDGNARWAKRSGDNGQEHEESEEDDSEKEKNARNLMVLHGTDTMAETVCACLGLDTKASCKKISSYMPYKTLNAAFPREVVREEVSKLLSIHIGHIAGLDAAAACMILTENSLHPAKRKLLSDAGIKLPLRFEGGLLFGQLVPRFDNRIIARCPLTWTILYDREIAAGKSKADAIKVAERDSKVPTVRSKEFLEYRFARVLANIRANGLPLPAQARQQLFEQAKQHGRLTPRGLKSAVELLVGKVSTNLDDYFKIHPDSAKSLVLDPAVAYAKSNKMISLIWEKVPQPVQSRAMNLWRRHKAVPLGQILAWTKEIDIPAAKSMEDTLSASLAKGKKGKKESESLDYWLIKQLCPEEESGRAPYSRFIMAKVVEEVMEGFDPNKPKRSASHPDGEEKNCDGILYPLLDPNSRVREVQNERPLDQLTNNHLVRHRLLILERLLDSLTGKFCDGDPTKVARCVVEVGRDLKEYSGMTAKEIASELNNKLKDFKAAVAHLKKYVPDMPLTGSLIRKCRIAMDLKWTCPFTGDTYDPADLPKMELEHIVPYSTRATNALHALVLTWPEVNRMKGKRTAYQFILEDQTKPVPGRTNLTVRNGNQFESFVEGLDVKGHPDDRRRKAARKGLLLTRCMDDRDLGFTPGQLTQSSHLMKLALRAISKRFPSAKTDPIPGVVNAEIRKAWNLTGALAVACPEIIDPDTGKARPKDEIRELTHLHHALDATVLGLTAHYFPLQYQGRDQKGNIWEAILKRNKSDQDWALLRELRIAKRDQSGRMALNEPPKEVKEQLARRLAECRVMQHIPADRSGAKSELTTWGIVGIVGDEVILIQRTNRSLLETEDSAPIRKWKDKGMTKDAVKLLDAHSSLLSSREKNLVKRGILKLSCERMSKLLGPEPVNGDGKLQAIRGAIIVGENYGMALDPEPTIIPFHSVNKILQSLKDRNGERPIRVLRNGMLIQLFGQGEFSGIWQIYTVQASLKIDLTRPGTVGRPRKGHQVWREASIHTLLRGGLKILQPDYAGHPAIPGE